MELYCGDCLEYMKTIEDNSIDLILTDPPYDVDIEGGGGTVNSALKLNISLQQLKDKQDISNGYDIVKYNKEFVRIMKNINIYLWCNKIQIPDYFNFYVNELQCRFDILCWHKTNAIPSYFNKYLSDTEYLLYFHKNAGCHPQNYEDAKTFYLAPINATDKKLYEHPTIKPLDITEKLIRNSSEEHHIVFDPFMGSGTTGVACKKLNRNFIGCEINEEYFNVASKRINGTSAKQETSKFEFDI